MRTPDPAKRLLHGPDGLNTAYWPPPLGELITPPDRFFTRSHAPVPAIDPATFRLQIDGLVHRPARFELKDLRERFARREVAATLVCAGLRRSEYVSPGPLPGELLWGPEAASTGVWSGVALRDVLEAVGIDDRARHVEFIGLDDVERHGERFGFGGSIDIDKATSVEVLLADSMNGAPLPAAHGFPLRTVVPGWIGARSVKWLGRITLRDEPSHNYFQRRAYRVQRHVNPDDPRDVSDGTALDAVPLNAVVASPAGGVLPAGEHAVGGWAIGAAGSPLVSVELSTDDGLTWRATDFERDGPAWTWRPWRATVHLNPGAHVLVVRASDACGNTQPSDVQSTWNVKGYCNNAWHRVAVECG